MKKPTITKEQLIKENAEMMAKINGLLTLDEVQRIEFAKAFGWTQNNEPSRLGTYSMSSTGPAKPTWAQIFVEVGRLLACSDFRDFEGNIRELACAIEEIKEHAEENNPAA